MWSVTRGGTEGLSCFGGGDIQQKLEVQTFGLAGGGPSLPQVSPLVVNPDLPIRKLLKRVLGLFTVMFLKRMSETIFFFKATNLQHIRLKEVTSSLMVFNLLKIIQPFHSKKHVRT